MKKEFGFECQENKDIFYHLLEEQIAYISVKEEEERIKEELKNGKALRDNE